MRHYPQRIQTIDRRRAEERILVHFDGEASRLLDINRGYMVLTEAEQIAKLIEALAETAGDPDSEVIEVKNRFAVPLQSGYRDLKFLLRDKETGFISTMRVVHLGYEESTYFDTAPNTWSIRSIRAKSMMRDRDITGSAVLVADNYHRDDEDSCHAIHGFPSREAAAYYAMGRFKDSLREIRKLVESTDELRMAWMLLGEDMFIIGEDGIDSYMSPHLISFIAELSLEEAIGCWDMEEKYDLAKFAVPM